MAKASKPFTPADCDLRGLPHMKLLGERLIESDLFFKSTGDEFKAAVALWWASWKQVPAASLPDDGRVLAGLARVDGRKWEKIRTGALHGWVKCSDGRLYHRTVADLALEAWEERQEYRANRESEADRKRREREERKAIFAALKALGVHMPWNTPLTELRRIAQEKGAKTVTDLSGGQVADVPDKEGRGRGTIKKEPPTPLAGGGEARSAIFEKAWAEYPEAGRGNHGAAEAWALWPPAAAKAGGEAALLAAVKARAAWLVHHPRERAKTFHRWLRDGGFEAYLPTTVTTPPWAGPAEIWTAVVAERGEPFAVSWLRSCAWQDVPSRALLCPNELTLHRLQDGVGGVLREMGIELQERAA